MTLLAPSTVIPVSAILMRIGRGWLPTLTPDQLYERTRRYWVCDPKARASPPSHALAVADGIIREVYRIERWETFRAWPPDRDPTRLAPFEPWPPGRVRRGFVGRPDEGLAGSLVGRSVRHVIVPGSRNPIAYVNC